MKYLLMTLIMVISGCASQSQYKASDLASLDDLFTEQPSVARQKMIVFKQQNPENSDIWNISGFWSVKEKNYARAGIAFRKSLQLNPDNPRALLGLGICADAEQHHFQAQTLYRQGLNIAPDDISLKNNLALSLLFTGDTNEALTLLEKLAQKVTPAEESEQPDERRIWSNLILAYAMNDRYSDAENIAVRLYGKDQASQYLKELTQNASL